MKDLLHEGVQAAASGKMAMAVGIGVVTAPEWIVWAEKLAQSAWFTLAAIVLGILVSITIITINVQTFVHRSRRMKETARQERIRTALLERQAAEHDITIS
jgi:uncharacterized membrane protein